MPNSSVVNLRALPSVWTNLCFPVGGIVQSLGLTLGQAVNGFDLPTFYGTLGSATERRASKNASLHIGFLEPDPAYLYNSADITNSLNASTLMSLRAEAVKAALDKVCAMRANVYLAKFANKAAIIQQMRANYSVASASSKPNRLVALAELADQQWQGLGTAYATAGPDGVVREDVVTSTSSILNLKSTEDVAAQQPNNNSTNNTVGTQNMTYFDYGFRMPTIEASAQNMRAQISLMDEQFAQFMMGQALPNLEDAFANELISMNSDVKRLQVAYANTILVSPVSGVVTGVYKQIGDAVLPGETVARIENNANVNLVGVLVYRQMLSVGAQATVQSKLFSGAAQSVLTGRVVAARGDPSGDDRWNVVISCPNGAAGGPPLVPPNYVFDYETTTVAIA